MKPQHIFILSSGTYIVSIIAFSNGGCISDTLSVSVTVTNSTSLNEQTDLSNLLKITNILGKECSFVKNKILFYHFSDGRIEQKVVIE